MNTEQLLLILIYWRDLMASGVAISLDDAAAQWIELNAAEYRKQQGGLT